MGGRGFFGLEFGVRTVCRRKLYNGVTCVI